MAKISELPVLRSPLGTETVVALSEGVSRSVPIGNLVEAAAEPVLAPFSERSHQRIGVPGDPVAGAGASTADTTWLLDTPFDKDGRVAFGLYAWTDSMATLMSLDGDDVVAFVEIWLVGGRINEFAVGVGPDDITLPMRANGRLAIHAVGETIAYQPGAPTGSTAWSSKSGRYTGGGGWTPAGGLIVLQISATNYSVDYPINLDSFRAVVSDLARIEAAPGAEMRRMIGPVELGETDPDVVEFDAGSTFLKEGNFDRGGVRYLNALSLPPSSGAGNVAILVYSRETNVLRRRASYTVAFSAGVSTLALGAGLPFIPLKPGQALALSNDVETPIALKGKPGAADRPLIVRDGKPDEILIGEQLAYEPMWQFDVRELVGVSSRQLFGRYVTNFTSMVHIIAYDQSNTSGADSTPILTASPSIYHRTFGVGPKMTMPGIVGAGGAPGTNPHDGTIKLYREDTVSPIATAAGMGQSPIGPAMASASRRLYARGGAFQQFFGSYAGFPGTTIDNIERGAPWFENYLYHIAKAKEHTEAIGFRYSTGVILTGHGESDQVAGTSYEIYFAKADRLVDDMIAAAQLNDGREAVAHVLVIPPSYAIKISDCAARTWTRLARERDDVHLVAPGYVFDYANNVHYLNVGQILRGEYWGRAIDQLSQGLKPDCAEWSRAWRRNDTVYAAVIAPTPMGWSTEPAGRQVVDKGVVINDAAGNPLQITDMTWSVSGVDRGTGWPISLLTIKTTGGEPDAFRYAMDNQGPSMWGVGGQILQGASGNICDMTTETVEIEGQVFRLAHYAPATILPLAPLE
ncbi:hypothetical protein NF700_00845 [Sphingomonadaceae bacterium OTU29MARTA1]|nr:hypothetical protein NF700_00845 [Sphingomonadaceae bacterium OTU29MARTA1]